jgi:hypothetical protein
MNLLHAIRTLLSDPDTGALSASVAMTVGAFLVSSVIVLDAAFTHTMTDYLFVGYLAVWALHCHATRLISLTQGKAAGDA